MERCGHRAPRRPRPRSGRPQPPRSSALPLLLVRDGERLPLPDGDTALRAGDEILYAGRDRARRAMEQTLLNANTAEYVLTGRDRPSSILARLIDRFAGERPAVG